MIEIRPLIPSDNRKLFSSGNSDLDRFFLRFAGQNQFKHHIGTTYIALEEQKIKGFVTVSASHLEIEDLPESRKKHLPRYPLPVLRLSRIAVDHFFQKQGIGSTLLKYVFLLAKEMKDKYGCIGLVVDAKPEAVGFYQPYGFETMEILKGTLEDRPQPTLMFLPVKDIP